MLCNLFRSRGGYPLSFLDEIVEVFKVRFIDGYSYWYLGFDFKIGDLVYVDGAKKKILGVVKEVSKKGEHDAIYFIEEKLGHINNSFNSNEIEDIWRSYKSKDRKIYLESKGIDTGVVKKKFISLMESKWIIFAKDCDNWDMFLKSLK